MELFFQHVDKDIKFFFLKIFTILINDWNYFAKNIKSMLEKHLQFE
jgi:hypothetical protein